MVGMIIVLAVYIFLIDIIGYLFATMVFFFMIFRIAGFRSWLIIGGLSIGISVSFYLVFVYWLGMIFPLGYCLNRLLNILGEESNGNYRWYN